MAQLSDDCFAFGGPLMTLEAAQDLLAERLTAVTGTESVALIDSLGRVLAGDVVSSVSVPPRLTVTRRGSRTAGRIMHQAYQQRFHAPRTWLRAWPMAFFSKNTCPSTPSG